MKWWIVACRCALLLPLSLVVAPGYADPSLSWEDATVPSTRTGTYEQGDVVSYVFKVDRSASATPPALRIQISDAEGHPVSQARLQMNDAGQQWQAKFEAPSSRLGFFRISAEAQSDQQLFKMPAVGSLAAGSVTYAIVPPVSSRRTVVPEDEAFFGMQGGFSNATLPLVPLMGIRWMGAGFDWAQLEPQRPHQMREALEKKAVDASALTRTIQARSVSWATFPLTSLHSRLPAWTKSLSADEVSSAWVEYCAGAAESINVGEAQFPKHIYQITWEPDLDDSYKNNANALLDIYKAAYPVIHSKDPAAVVIGPTFSNIDVGNRKFNDQLIQLGLLRYIDAWAVHPYNHAADPLTIQQQFRQLRTDMQALGGKQLPIYATEHGYQAKPEPADELFQARYMVETNVVLYGEGAKMAISFYIHDYKDQPGMGFYYNLNPKIAYGTDWVAPKPAAAAYAAMTKMLDGVHAVGEVNAGPGLVAYQFDRGGKSTFVVWSTDQSARSGRVNCDRAALKVYDWMGNANGSAKCGASQSFGPDPVYLVSE